jgi:hypothetical protein
MTVSFDLNLDHAYAETLRQQHEARAAQELISELEDKIGSAVSVAFERHRVLPGPGDRVEADLDWWVINARSFGQDGTVWLSVKPFVV